MCQGWVEVTSILYRVWDLNSRHLLAQYVKILVEGKVPLLHRNSLDLALNLAVLQHILKPMLDTWGHWSCLFVVSFVWFPVNCNKWQDFVSSQLTRSIPLGFSLGVTAPADGCAVVEHPTYRALKQCCYHGIVLQALNLSENLILSDPFYLLYKLTKWQGETIMKKTFCLHCFLKHSWQENASVITVLFINRDCHHGTNFETWSQTKRSCI